MHPTTYIVRGKGKKECGLSDYLMHAKSKNVPAENSAQTVPKGSFSPQTGLEAF